MPSNVWPPTGPHLTIGGLPCVLKVDNDGQDTIVERVEQGPEAIVKFKCLWTDRYKIVAGLGGTATLNSNGKVQRIPPFLYPDSPNLRAMAIESITGIKYRTRADGWGTYQYAVLAVKFGIFPWSFGDGNDLGANDPSGQPWTTTRFRVNGEFVRPPLRSYKWVGGPDIGKHVAEGLVGKIEPNVEISMTRHWLPYVPLPDVIDSIGKVNSNNITFGYLGNSYTFPKGTVLLAGINVMETKDTIGNNVFEWEYVIIGKGEVDGGDVTWNHLIASDASYQMITEDGTAGGTPPYRFLDFSTLP